MPADKKLEVQLVLTDRLSKHLERVRKEIRMLEQRAVASAGRITGAFMAMLKPFRYILNHVFSLRTAFLALGAAWAATRFADSATRIETVEHGFKMLSQRIGSDVVPLLEKLRRATKGTVDDMKLMELANRGMALGAVRSAQDMETLVWTARRLGRVLGLDVGFAIDKLTTGLARMSYRLVDDVGLTLRLADAKTRYAQATGKLVSELTAEDIQTAFIQEFMLKASDLMKSMGEDVDFVADKWQRFKATLANFWQDVQRAMLPLIGDLSEKLTNALNENREAIFNWLASLLEGAHQVLPAVIESVRYLITELQVLWGPFKDIALTIVKIREGAADIASKNAVRNFAAAAGREFPGGAGMYYKPQSGLDRALGMYRQRDPWDSAADFERMIQEDPSLLQKYPGVAERYDQFKKARDEYINITQLRTYMERGGTYSDQGPPNPNDPYAFLTKAAQGLRAQGLKSRKIPGMDEGEPLGVQQVKESTKELSRLEQVLGKIGETLSEVYTKFMDTFEMAKNAVLDTSNALVNNLAQGFVDLMQKPSQFKEAIKNMARGVLDDLAKILARMVAIRIIGFAIGLIPGVGTANASGAGDAAARGAAMDAKAIQSTPDIMSTMPQVSGGGGMVEMYQSGGIRGPRSPAIFGEGSTPEAAVPLPGNRHIPVEFVGHAAAMGGGGGGNTYIIQTIDAKSFDEYFRESAGRQPGVIGSIAGRQYQDNRSVRRMMRR